LLIAIVKEKNSAAVFQGSVESLELLGATTHYRIKMGGITVLGDEDQ